jgi:hypothetical protein
MDRDWDWDSLDVRKGGLGMTRRQRMLGEDIQQQSGDEPDETEDPSDFCDFGYDVVSNTDGQSERHCDWDKAATAVTGIEERLRAHFKTRLSARFHRQ